MAETIEIVPTWSAILPQILAVYQDGETFDSRRDAEQMLRHIAKLADYYVESVKEK